MYLVIATYYGNLWDKLDNVGCMLPLQYLKSHKNALIVRFEDGVLQSRLITFHKNNYFPRNNNFRLERYHFYYTQNLFHFCATFYEFPRASSSKIERLLRRIEPIYQTTIFAQFFHVRTLLLPFTDSRID